MAVLEKHCILQISFILTVASWNKCSEFNFISLVIFLLKHKALYKQNFLEWVFIYKFEYWDDWNVCVIRLEQLRESSLTWKAFNTSECLNLSRRVISIFLRARVLQTDSPSERNDNPTFRVDSPTKPILAVFSPTDRWSYSPVELSIQ